MSYYIQHKASELETIDEFNSLKEAKAALIEYKLSDKTALYYISTRCCKTWSN